MAGELKRHMFPQGFEHANTKEVSMDYETVQIVQIAADMWHAIGELLSSAAVGLWHRDELLFVAVVAILIQTCWILSLRFRLRRLRKKLGKHQDQVGKEEGKRVKKKEHKRVPMWTMLVRGAQSKAPEASD